MADLGLDEKEMNIILKEFIYGERMGGGENKSNEIEKLEVVKSLLTSSRYKDMVENLIMEHFYADNNNITSANIYDHFGTAYLFWLITTGKTELVKLEEMDDETASNFKKKYVRHLLSQHKIGQMIRTGVN